jgi:hypothetical protein
VRPRLILLALCLLWAAPARAGDELPFYPGYYPQEIRLDVLPPGAAVSLLKSSALHAYIGANPFPLGRVPSDVRPIESLAGYVVVTFNLASPAAASRENRCEAARRIARSLSPAPGAFIPHPYPVTPYDGDYLEHFDLAQAARRSYASPSARAALPLRVHAKGALAERLLKTASKDAAKHWDATVEEIDVESLLAAHGVALNGWLGPPWLKEGWFHAYLLGAGPLSDTAERQAAEALYRRLATGAYSGPTERIELERRLVSRVTAGCERAVLGYTVRREYFSAEFSQGVENIAWDSQTGFNSAIFLRTVKLKDFPWNGWLRLGIASRPAAAWNPVAGFSDPAGRLLWGALGDPALLPAPYGGGWLPNRIRVAAVTRSATSDVAIPENALIPEAGTGLLREVGKGRSARARVTYRLVASAFHDNTRMTPADAAYAYSFAYRWGAKGAEAGGDPAVAAATEQIRESLAGFRVLKVDTEVKKYSDMTFTYVVPVIDVYLNSGGLEAERLAALAPPWSPVPWHVLALMDEAARRGLGAFSAAEAKRRGVPWLDLARDAKTKAALASLVDGFAAQAWVPPALKELVMADEAQTRWAALKSFYATRGHFLVTNGSYSLEKWSERDVTLQVFRDFTNPNGAGTYDHFAIPRRAYITRLAARGDRLEVVGEVERVEKFLRDYRVVREPLGQPASDHDHADVLVCRYLIVGADGAVADAGQSRELDGARLVVNLKGRLKPGSYTALVALALGDNWVNPEIAMTQFRVEAAP